MSEYLALPDGAGSFPQGFSDPVVLRDLARTSCLTRTGLSPSVALFSKSASISTRSPFCKPYDPDAAETAPV